MATFSRPQRKYNFSDDRFISMCIYKITNKWDGKSYIGQSIGKVAERWRAHCRWNKQYRSAIGSAIIKFGVGNFDFSVIKIVGTLEELNYFEKYYIGHYDTIAPSGYNLTSGGDNFYCSEETKKRQSDSALRRHALTERRIRPPVHLSTEEREQRKKSRIRKMAISKTGKPSGRRGMKLTSEWVENIRLSKIGNANHNTPVLRSDGQIFASIKQAAIDINAKPNSILKVLNGSRKKIYGFGFDYLATRVEVNLSQPLQSPPRIRT